MTPGHPLSVRGVHTRLMDAINLMDESSCLLSTYKGVAKRQGPVLLTRIIYNPIMDKLSHVQWNVGWNYLSGGIVDVWE